MIPSGIDRQALNKLAFSGRQKGLALKKEKLEQ